QPTKLLAVLKTILAETVTPNIENRIIRNFQDALRSLDYLREMVVRDSRTLGVLEQLLVGDHVGMRLKDGYVADMQKMV
nr:hypothetical protein [Tanacetum cinerariifolium]